MNRRVFFANVVAGVVGLVGFSKGVAVLAAQATFASRPAGAPASAALAPIRGLSPFQQDLVSRPIDREEVREAFEGNHHCQWLLGEYLEALPDTEADWTRALSRLREAARAGDTWPAEFLGNDPKEWADTAGWSPRGLMESRSVVLLPFFWFHRAAEQGHCQAMHGIARVFAYSVGDQHDDVEALFWTILATTYRDGASGSYPPSGEALALWMDLVERVSPEEYRITKVRASMWRHKLERRA